MSTRNLLIALVVLAVLAGAWWLIRDVRDPYTASRTEDVFAELRAKLSPGEAVRIVMGKSDGDTHCVLERQDNQWILPDLYGYPAKAEDVNRLILDTMRIGDAELKGRNPNSHPGFEVCADKGKTLVIEGAGGRALCALVIGKYEPGSMNRGYVRHADSSEVYSVSPTLSGRMNAWGTHWDKNWLDDTLARLDSDKGEEIVKVEVTRAGGESFTLEKVEEEKAVAQAEDDDAADQTSEPATVKETKWYVTAGGERFEPDASARSSFVSQLDRIAGTDPVEPRELAAYGLDPAYLLIKATTAYTKEEHKSEKPRVYEILIGDLVPEDPKDAGAVQAQGDEDFAPPDAGDWDDEDADDWDDDGAGAPEDAGEASPANPPPSTETSTSSAAPEAEPAAAPEAAPPPEPPPVPAVEPAPEFEPLPAPALELPVTPVPGVALPADAPDTPAPAPATPGFKKDRYLTVRGDRRIMTIAEWKLNSIDKKAEDFRPKTPEVKVEADVPPDAPTDAPSVEAGLDAPPVWSARHILIMHTESIRKAESVTRTKEEARTLAAELIEELTSDRATFAQLAASLSDCPSGKNEDDPGDLGEFGPGAMTPPFENAVKALTVGALSEVVETDFGFHIIERTR